MEQDWTKAETYEEGLDVAVIPPVVSFLLDSTWWGDAIEEYCRMSGIGIKRHS